MEKSDDAVPIPALLSTAFRDISLLIGNRRIVSRFSKKKIFLKTYK